MKNNPSTAKIIKRLTVSLSLLLVCLPPMIYGIFSYQYIQGSLITEVEINSRLVNEIINNNPDLWEYETLRLEEVLSSRPGSGEKEIRRVVDLQGRIVAESKDTLSPPLIIRSHLVMDSGLEVGRIEIIRSLKLFLLNLGIFCAVGLALGLGFIALIRLPARALKKAEKEMKQQKTQLEQRNRALRQFNYAVSHELKTPLVSIESSLGLIQSTLPQTTDPELTTAFGYARHATRQMNNLLESLLLMFRIDAADTDTEATAFGVLVQDAIDQLTRENRLKGIHVTISAEGPTLSGDQHKLVQIWLQLIDNATKYMGDQKDPTIDIGIEQTGQEVQFYVRDNGKGIEKSYQDKIFGLFDQLNKTADGTGLGLTLVKRIVEYYGGTIRVESEGLGKGSCFYFTLPDIQSNQGTTS